MTSAPIVKVSLPIDFFFFWHIQDTIDYISFLHLYLFSKRGDELLNKFVLSLIHVEVISIWPCVSLFCFSRISYWSVLPWVPSIGILFIPIPIATRTNTVQSVCPLWPKKPKPVRTFTVLPDTKISSRFEVVLIILICFFSSSTFVKFSSQARRCRMISSFSFSCSLSMSIFISWNSDCAFRVRLILVNTSHLLNNLA